jgi:preprotein translocase subunit SecG
MYGFLLAVLVLDGLFLAVVILLQSGKGGGLAAVGGSGGTVADGVLGGRQATTVLTRATWTAGGIFLGLALVLSILSSRAQAPSSIIQVNAPAATTAPEPVLPGLGDQPAANPSGDGNEGNEGN